MHSNDSRNMQHIAQTAAIFIAVLFFVVGRFGFFDILGLKRVVEFMLFLPLSLLGIAFLFDVPKKWFSPFLLLPCLYFLTQLCWDPDFLALADISGSILIISIILALGPAFSDLLLRHVIKIATFFAVLGITEFFLLLLNPSLVKHILLFYDHYSASSVPVIDNPLQLLGLADGTSYHLWGMAVTRLRSFASEPSLLVGYFLVPGALGLTYKGKYAIYGLICIFFCICSLAGSVYAALAFSILSSLLLLLRNRRLIMILPFLLLVIFFWVLFTHYNELIILTKSTGSDYDFLDKTHSANMRFSYIREFLPIVISSPFGIAEGIHQPLGLLVGAMARGGILGLILMIWILSKIYDKFSFLLISKYIPLPSKVGLLLIYGSLLTGITYLDNSFIQSFSFLLLLTDNCFAKLLAEANSKRVALEARYRGAE